MKKLSEEIKFIKVGELSPNIRDVNLVAKVLELGEVRTVTSRNSGEEHQVMDILIGDDSGIVYFSAWNEQIEKIKNEETYQFRSAKTILFKRNIRLSLGKQGFLEDSKEKVESVEESNNVSTGEHDIPRRWDNRSSGGSKRYDR